MGTGLAGMEIAHALAAQIGIEANFIGYPTPAKAVEALKLGACDLAFLGIEPSRTAELDFSPAVFQFDYTYLVPQDSPIHDTADADRPGVRIAIVRNHASALALSRIIKRAEFVASELPDAAFGCRSPRSGGRRRRRGRALRACSRINRSIRCSPHDAPSASMSRHTRLAPWVRSLARKLARTFAPSSSLLRLCRLRGRVSQA
jgi:hypothetical protein